MWPIFPVLVRQKVSKAYLRSLLSYHIPARSSTLLRHRSIVGSSGPHNLCFPRYHRYCPPQYGTHSLLAFALILHQSPHTFCRLLKTHCFDQTFSSPYSGSPKCLGFSLWPTLCTLKGFFKFAYTY